MQASSPASRTWRTGFDIPIRSSAMAPVVTIGFVVIAIVDNTFVGTGDIRKGLFPWAMAFAVVCLAICSLGILAAHSPGVDRWLVVGSWWTTAAFAGIAGFLFAIGVGGLLGIEEDQVGVIAMIPFVGMIFGILSITPAMIALGFGASRSRVLPRWGVNAVWVAAPAIPAVLISGGAFEGSAESMGFVGLLTLFLIAWLVIGRSLSASAIEQTSRAGGAIGPLPDQP